MALKSSSCPTSCPSLSTIRKILCNQCPATRRLEDLEAIYSFLTSRTEIELDPLWNFLPHVLRLELCAYFSYVRLDESELIHIKSLTDGCSSKLYLLVRGKGELACGDSTMSLDGQHGPSLGNISVPRRVQCLMQPNEPTTNTNTSPHGGICKAFLRQFQSTGGTLEHLERIKQITVSLQRGSHYIYFSTIECREYVNLLFDRIVFHWVFHKLHLKRVKPAKRRPCKFNLFIFPKGHSLFIEGLTSNTIVLTLRGKCQLKKVIPHKKNRDDFRINHDNDESVHIGFAGPLSLLGFLPHVIAQKAEESNQQHQPFTAIAKTRIRVAVFEPCVFVDWIRRVPYMIDALRHLAERQLDWLTNTLPDKLNGRENLGKERKEIEITSGHVQSLTIIDDFPTSTCVDMEEIINSRELKKKKCRSNKHKLLKGLKQRMVKDEANEDKDWVEYEELDDQFSRFDFIDTSMYNLQKEILLDDSVGKNDDSSGEETNMDTIDHRDYSTRQEHDRLKPHPSILLSRKAFGKTLPIVRQSKGFLDPRDPHIPP